MLAEVQVATPHPKKSVNRTYKSKSRGKDGPVFGIACAEPLSRFGFKLAVNVVREDRSHCGQ